MNRHPDNPILTRGEIPDVAGHHIDVTSVFNPGAVRREGQTLLLLRVQDRGRRTFFMMAESRDGVHFYVPPEVVRFRGLEKVKEPVYHCYDGRITRIGSDHFILFAMDMDSGCQLGLGRTADFREFDFLGIASTEDSRNGVLFPEKIGGRYLRLERPNRVAVAGGPTTGSTIVLSESDDLLAWRQVAPVASGRFHYWDEYIGAGPPPLKTAEGWLLIYHGVATHLSSIFIYQAGVMLLDLADPSRVIARGACNILEPRKPYELVGQVPNVVFPSGLVAETVDEQGFAPPESRVQVYYGAADTCVCLAETTVADLIRQAKRQE